MQLPFVKMHGAGNDFVMLDGVSRQLPADLSELSRILCHRRFGIGADQVLIARVSTQADFTMDIFNADGGRVEMCGNGIRCFLQYVRDLGLTQKTELVIDTLAGLIKPQLIADHPKTTANTVWVSVDMGVPELLGENIPVRHKGRVVNFSWRPQNDTGEEFKITCVSMGNPHCVIFVDDVDNFPVQEIGSLIEHDPFFPQRVNVEFVEIKSRTHLLQRTWERGSGETLACGTGACAVSVAAALNGFAERELTISLRGGDLDLRWDESTGHVFKTGPSTRVYSGLWERE